MYIRRTSMRAAVLVVFLSVFVLASFPSYSSATVTCVKGTSRLATSADIEKMRLAGIPNPTVGMEYCPDDINTGASAGEAKIYLRSVLCPPDGDNYGGMGPDETIEGLDPEFAKCAATFLKQLNSNSGGYCVREGKRTVAKQEEYVARGVKACKKGAACEHPRGIAIDINSRFGNKNSCDPYKPAHQLAPQFGLTFYLGCSDAYHFVPLKTGCSAGGTAPSGGAYNPNSQLPATYYDYPQYAPTGAPTAPMSQPFSTPLTGLQTPQSQPTGVSTPTGQTTDTNTSYPTNYNGIPLPTATSSVLSIPPPYTYPFGTSTDTGASPLSAYEQILMIVGTTSTGSSQSTSTSSPTRLNDDLYDIVTSSNTGGTNVPDTALAYATNSVPLNPIHVTETFTNTNPQQPVQVTSTVANTSLIVSLLTTLRDFLLTYVNILKSQQTYGFDAPWRQTTPGSSVMR